ncbi:MAG: protein kinase [Melioribacteraceae bacterium]|nr:protein kinase [Melioribacteraceae bacterium]MCF8356007.1 protein kinase [Melioribacteraceae bacterium]MCF8394682.1 protein kinase [Melioribacteraceae bacterium]MCF8420240.1 protein kinase [Melioribacteraceae bacterium]
MVDDFPEILNRKYRVKQCIKKSETGAVFICTELKNGKDVIVKILWNKAVQDDELVRRFKREAGILSKLNHPNIIRLIEFKIETELLYIIFEYFEAGTLRHYIKNDNLSDEKKLKLVKQLFSGLSYLHKHNIVHRDLKPENILINNDLKLKITDFGLSFTLGDEFTTRIDSIVGTPCYMSPEQIHGKVPTSQSDLFSAGVLIFELYTKHNLFLANNFNETINNILNFDENSIRDKIKELPPNIALILSNTIAKEIGKRAENAEEILSMLEDDSKKQKKKPLLKYAAAFVLFIVFDVILIFVFTYDQKKDLASIDTLSHSENILNTDPVMPEPGNEIAKTPVNDSNTESDKPADETQDVQLKNEEDIPEENISIDTAGFSSIPDSELENSAEIIQYGYLQIESFPWTEVMINDSSYGITPFNDAFKLKTGNYDVTFKHPDFPDLEKSVSISADSISALNINMRSSFSYLDCKVFPWADVYLNEIYLGQTPFDKIKAVSPGTYTLKVKNPNFDDFTKEVVFNLNDTVKINLNLQSL